MQLQPGLQARVHAVSALETTFEGNMMTRFQTLLSSSTCAAPMTRRGRGRLSHCSATTSLGREPYTRPLTCFSGPDLRYPFSVIAETTPTRRSAYVVECRVEPQEVSYSEALSPGSSPPSSSAPRAPASAQPRSPRWGTRGASASAS